MYNSVVYFRVIFWYSYERRNNDITVSNIDLIIIGAFAGPIVGLITYSITNSNKVLFKKRKDKNIK